MRFASPLMPLHRIAFDEALSRQQREGAHRPNAATGHPSEASAPIEYLAFGPVDAAGEATCPVIAAVESTELEYAAIRRGAALFDESWRGTIEVTGADRIDLLNRLVTQDLRPIKEGGVARAFLTNRKGRIDADLVIAETGTRTLLDLVVHDAATVASIIEKFVFAETATVRDVTASLHALSLHGPRATEVLQALGLEAPAPCAVTCSALLGGTTVIALPSLGELGYSIRVPYGSAGALWNALREQSSVRCAGWHAYNIARVENGEPMFRIDFGPTNLPHETGVLPSRVSFTKGCYPGQEVVARMQHLGKPKQMLVGLRVQGDALPMGDAMVFSRNDDGTTGEHVGAVTSSSVAPMLSAASVAFAMLRSAQTTEGTEVFVECEGAMLPARVQSLRFFGGGGR